MCRRRVKPISATILSVGASLMLGQPLIADVILQPVAVSSEEAGPVGSTIDQSGLGVPYVSGTTQFSTYVATATHDNLAASVALFDPVFPQTFTFDLGSVRQIDGFALWSPFLGTGIRDFSLFSDDDSDLGNGTLSNLGSFTAANVVDGQSFLFSETTSQFFHATVDNYYNNDDLRVGEFAFRQATSVPEPSAFLFLGCLSLGLVAVRRRWSARMLNE